MRSFDYCHFEINLTASETPNLSVDPTDPLRVVSSASFDAGISLIDVDLLRKEAARLADKAVAQYKAMKKAIQRAEIAGHNVESMTADVDSILALPEGERTPELKATLKRYHDLRFAASRQYNYEDDWQDDDQ